MLSWLWNRIAGHAKPPEPPVLVPPGPRVRFDGVSITVPRRDGNEESLAWADLTSVTILTSDAGPLAPDLFWVLAGREKGRSLVVEMGQAGEHELLKAMQARLQGFDNMAVVEAMGTTQNASFLVWQQGGKREQSGPG